MNHLSAGYATKKEMCRSLKKLMSRKPLNRISIREIVEDCGYNRQTYYYHFKNIYDQLEWLYRDEFLALVENYDDNALLQEGFLNLLKYVDENRDFCLCAIDSAGYPLLRKVLYPDFKRTIGNVIFKFKAAHNYSDKYADFLIHFYTATCLSMTASYIYGEIDASPEELVGFFDMTLMDHMGGAIERNGSMDNAVRFL